MNDKVWPPDYSDEITRRIKLLRKLNSDPDLRHAVMSHYKNNPIDWINDWSITYDPRNKSPKPKMLPFVLFPKQEELILFLLSCIDEGESGLVEKCRDMGASWVCCAFSVWLWIFKDGASVGWGSRKEMLVDKLGDPDSIFQKMRIIIQNLPLWMLPDGFSEREHSNYMKLINPESGANIVGEAGDNIGRGGRSMIYFKDESAHYERPELIEAALGDNTDVQIDISSVRGTGNVFYRRRMAGHIWEKDSDMERGRTRIFIMDWRDHPLKTQDWYDRRRAKWERDGLLHIFSQEVDRDYTSSMDRIVIPQKWVKAAVDAHIKLGISEDGEKVAGLDVADEGGDKNALSIKYGVILKYCEHWGEGDVGNSARRSFSKSMEMGCTSFNYDSVGVGSGVKSEANRMRDDGVLSQNLIISPWNGGASPLNKEEHLIQNDRNSPIIGDFFLNLKAQAWWNLRTRFENTYKAIVEGEDYPHEELISLPSSLPRLHEIMMELSQPQVIYDGKGKLKIDKKPDGSKSPNLADSIVMCYTSNKIISILDAI